jgi:hypothetical protein
MAVRVLISMPLRREGRGLALTGSQRQAHDFPAPHPADPDEFADPVLALRLSRCHEGVSLHLRQKRFRCAEISRMQALAMAWRASSPPSAPSAALSKVGRVSSMLRVKAAAGIASLPGKSRKRYGCVTPTRLAIASAEVP